MNAIQYWQPYEPTGVAPWNLRRAVHLHRRAEFAATWGELQRDLAGSPQEAVTRVLEGKSRSDGQLSEFASTADLLTEAAIVSGQEQRLKAAWLYRMLFAPDPLQEHLALAWHNHFATSNRKVRDLKRMQQQNNLLRQHARGSFATLLTAAVHDPAMLVWLDADTNRAGKPNENLARELLELFTLGVGHYTEEDVLAVARSLTGWKVVSDQFRFDDKAHDDGEKTVLGQCGKFTGDDVLAMLCKQQATAENIVRRLLRMFMAEGTVDAPSIQALAVGLAERELNIGWAVGTILRSNRFFADENLHSRVLSPPEFVVGAVRALECLNPPPSTLLLAEWTTRMGQDLFYPPNVGGWKEGLSWLGSGAIVARSNLVSALVSGRLAHDRARPNLRALVERHAGTKSLADSVQWFGELLFGGISKETAQAIATEANSTQEKNDDPLAAALVLLMARAESHLG